jgi:hypothetical protein
MMAVDTAVHRRSHVVVTTLFLLSSSQDSACRCRERWRKQEVVGLVWRTRLPLWRTSQPLRSQSMGHRYWLQRLRLPVVPSRSTALALPCLQMLALPTRTPTLLHERYHRPFPRSGGSAALGVRAMPAKAAQVRALSIGVPQGPDSPCLDFRGCALTRASVACTSRLVCVATGDSMRHAAREGFTRYWCVMAAPNAPPKAQAVPAHGSMSDGKSSTSVIPLQREQWSEVTLHPDARTCVSHTYPTVRLRALVLCVPLPRFVFFRL